MFGFVFSFLCFLAILKLLERQIHFLFLTVSVYTDDFPPVKHRMIDQCCE